MNCKQKYLFKKDFDNFISNDFHDIKMKVALNTKLLWIILTALIVAFVAERLI